MEQKVDIAIIGECLIELSANGSLADTSTLNKYFGGDTVTTAVAIARLGGNVTYITKIGNDGFSEFLLSSLQKENIDTSLVKTNDEQNGMYIVSHTQDNKEVLYYKRKTAATKLSIDDISEETIKKLKLVYSTGVVQSLSASSRELIRETFRLAKENDVLTAYDPNYTYLESAGDTTFEGATLSLKSETTLSLYFKSSTDLIFECYPYEVEKSTTADGYQIARIRGIKAADLDETFHLDIDDAAESGSSFFGYVDYCPLTYCYNVLSGGSDDENLKNVCRALYLYWQAANEYFG